MKTYAALIVLALLAAVAIVGLEYAGISTTIAFLVVLVPATLAALAVWRRRDNARR